MNLRQIVKHLRGKEDLEGFCRDMTDWMRVNSFFADYEIEVDRDPRETTMTITHDEEGLKYFFDVAIEYDREQFDWSDFKITGVSKATVSRTEVLFQA